MVSIGLGIGIGTSRKGGVSAPVLPLFADGGKGAWYDPSDISTLFQDSGGTIAVTADGDPVGLVKDKSGNGNHWVATSDANRPVYKTDGTLFWLQFNGSTSALSCPISSLPMMMDIYAALEPDAGETIYPAFYETAGGTITLGFVYPSSGAQMVNPTQPAMAYVDRRKTGPLSSDILAGMGNGASNALHILELRACTLGSWANFAFGGFGGTFSYSGKIYGVILAPYAVASRREPAQAFLAGKSGISLPPPEVGPAIAVLGDSTIAAYVNRSDVPNGITGLGEIFNFAVPFQAIQQQQGRWDLLPTYSPFQAVVIQIGLNNITPSFAAPPVISLLQGLVDDVRSKVGPTCKVLIGQMIPCKQSFIDAYGATNGALAQQQWVDVNAAIAGSGPTPITGVDARITAHVAALSDGSGNLAAIYDSGDHLHENAAGLVPIQSAWRDALVSVGVLS